MTGEDLSRRIHDPCPVDESLEVREATERAWQEQLSECGCHCRIKGIPNPHIHLRFAVFFRCPDCHMLTGLEPVICGCFSGAGHGWN